MNLLDILIRLKNEAPTTLTVEEKLQFIDTLDTRHSDHLDFHEVSVWGVKSALFAAYQAGLRAGQGDAVHD